MKYLKQTTFFAIFTLFVFYSCDSPLKPEGKLDDKSINLKKFDEIELSGRFRVIFIEDSIYQVRIESFTNLIENLEIAQNKENLIIKEKNKVDENIEIYNVFIHSKHVKELKVNEFVLVDSPSFLKNDDLKISLNDESKFIAEIQSKNFELILNDNSDANLKGNTLELDLSANDKSVLKAPFFVIDIADVTFSDISQAELNIKSEIKGSVNDNSKLIYIGNPSKDLDQNDLAKVEERK